MPPARKAIPAKPSRAQLIIPSKKPTKRAAAPMTAAKTPSPPVNVP